MKDYMKEYGSLKLRSGAGKSWENGLCVMEAVAWLNGENATDRPECACPVLGAYAIRLNDRLNDDNRQKLLPLALELTGTRSKQHEKIRYEFIVLETAKRIASIAFDKINMPEFASEFRNVKTIAQLKDVANRAKGAADTSAAAYASASAAASAAASAYASAAADTYAAASAAAAADTYTSAYTTRQETLLMCVPILKEAIALGPNGKAEIESLIPRVTELGKFADTVLA